MALWRLVEYFKWHCGHFEYLLHDRLVGYLFIKDKKDMLWPDMIWYYILAYDIWNFQYTYLNLPTHAWYCGFALLLAPTVANALWNKGGWIQNRANTLALWCMFAQVFPLFQDGSRFSHRFFRIWSGRRGSGSWGVHADCSQSHGAGNHLGAFNRGQCGCLCNHPCAGEAAEAESVYQ